MWQSALNENFPSAVLVIILGNNTSTFGLNIQINRTGTFLPFEEGQVLAFHSNATMTAGSFLQLDQGGLGSNEEMALKGKINLILENLRNY